MTGSVRSAGWVYLALLAGTAATFGYAFLGHGKNLALWVAFGLGAFKAALIGWYYMDVRSAEPTVRVVALVAVVAVIVMIVGFLPDVGLLK